MQGQQTMKTMRRRRRRTGQQGLRRGARRRHRQQQREPGQPRAQRECEWEDGGGRRWAWLATHRGSLFVQYGAVGAGRSKR